MSLQNDPRYFPQPDVPTGGNYNRNFGKEQLYQAYLPRSANVESANASAGDKSPSNGKYTFDPATGQYTWVPANAAATSVTAPVIGIPEQRGGGRDRPDLGNYSAPSTQSLGEGLASAGVNYGNILGGMMPLGGLAGALGKSYINNRLSQAATEGGYTGTYTGDAAFGKDGINNIATEGGLGPLSGGGFGPTQGNNVSGATVGGEGGNSGGNFGGGFGAGDGGGGIGRGEGGADSGGEHGAGGPGMATGGLSDLGGYSDGGRLLRGPGDGVSDSIPAVIGHKRPARLADGEFVVPARIVSELGNGSTEAGARKLYAMLDRIQAGRKKSIGKGKVATNSRMDKNLPA